MLKTYKKQKTERHNLQSALGYVSKNACEWDSNHVLTNQRHSLA